MHRLVHRCNATWSWRGPMFTGTWGLQLSLSLPGPPSGHLSDQGSPAAPTPGDPHHQGLRREGLLRPSFVPGVTPRRGQLSSAVGATGDFFLHDVTQIARASLPPQPQRLLPPVVPASATSSASASALHSLLRRPLAMHLPWSCGLGFRFRMGLHFRFR